jgi:hypothetical protein
MHEPRIALGHDVDDELERIITELAASQTNRRADTRRRLRRQILFMLREQGFSVGDLFPAIRHGRGGRHTSRGNGLRETTTGRSRQPKAPR